MDRDTAPMLKAVACSANPMKIVAIPAAQIGRCSSDQSWRRENDGAAGSPSAALRSSTSAHAFASAASTTRTTTVTRPASSLFVGANRGTSRSSPKPARRRPGFEQMLPVHNVVVYYTLNARRPLIRRSLLPERQQMIRPRSLLPSSPYVTSSPSTRRPLASAPCHELDNATAVAWNGLLGRLPRAFPDRLTKPLRGRNACQHQYAVRTSTGPARAHQSATPAIRTHPRVPSPPFLATPASGRGSVLRGCSRGGIPVATSVQPEASACALARGMVLTRLLRPDALERRLTFVPRIPPPHHAVSYLH